MMHSFFVFIIAMTLLIQASAQNNNSQQQQQGKAVIGTSMLPLLWDDDPYFFEFSWTLNAAIPLNKFHLGTNFYLVHTRGGWSGQNNYYYLAGVFSQYNFLKPKYKSRLYAELSFNTGNYCTCGNRDPYRKDGLYYIGIGGGWDIKLSERWHIDLAFLSYNILNKIKNEYGYTDAYGYNIPVIGVDYHW